MTRLNILLLHLINTIRLVRGHHRSEHFNRTSLHPLAFSMSGITSKDSALLAPRPYPSRLPLNPHDAKY